MKRYIKKLLREGLLLTENSLYGRKIIDGVTKKIGDSSDDTLNKIAIAGLYRNVFGNVQQLKSKELLDKVFDGWYNTTIEKMVKTSAFIDNKDLATKYLDAYIENIKTLGNNARPFSFKKIESGLVDLVNNNGWIKDNSIKQANDIYNPKDDDVVYEDENVIILDTNTKAKCVMYGSGESWCITKPLLNYYNTYRIKYGATPYFVLQKNVKGNEHKLVIMHYKNGYAIADRSNSGARAGSKSSVKPWSYVEQQIPNLKGLEKYFPYREITEDEERYEEILKRTKDYKGANLQGYIDNEIRGLVINGSQVTDVDFIRDYAALGVKISDNQIKSLRPEVVNSLIEGGYFLTKGSEQTNILNPKQQLRVVRIKIQNKIELTGDELLLLPEKEINDYMSKLDIYTKKLLLRNSQYNEKIIYRLLRDEEYLKFLGRQGYGSEFEFEELGLLLLNSENPDKVLNLLGDKKDDIIDRLNNSKKIYGKIEAYFSNSKAPDKLLQLFDLKDEYLEDMTRYDIKRVLEKTKVPYKVINVLGDKGKQFISNLNSKVIEDLLTYSKEPEKVIDALGDKVKQFISNLDSKGIIFLLALSKNFEKTKQILIKYGHEGFFNQFGKQG